MMDIVVSIVILVITAPISLFISLIIKLTSDGSVLFFQKRSGKNGKVFKIIKFRTMISGADKFQKKYKDLNESDGPVFKIRNDPRFTTFGKILSNTGLDELPQFINVLKGDMSIVGPRPLPVEEAGKLSITQKIRESINPGITSNWVVQGSHKMKFNEWMKLDCEYVRSASFFSDISIMLQTVLLIVHFILML